MELQYENANYTANYNEFWTEDETTNYKLTVTGYNGTAGMFPTISHLVIFANIFNMKNLLSIIYPNKKMYTESTLT